MDEATRDRMDRLRVHLVGKSLSAELAGRNDSAEALFATDPEGFWGESTRLNLIVRDVDSDGFLVGTFGLDRELQTEDDIFFYFTAEESSVQSSED